MNIDEIPPIRPRRKIRGMSAVFLPFDADGTIDWDAFAAHVVRTADAGLTPAVNLDVPFWSRLEESTRLEVLRRTPGCLAGREFVAGAVVIDEPGDSFALMAYLKQVEAVAQHGGTPVICQSYGLAHQDAEHVVNDYEALAACCDRFFAMETTEEYAPCGRIYNADVYEAMLGIPECLGDVCTSRHRKHLWQRLKLRDRRRPEFLVLSGNDLALDLVTYGCDYLSAISTMAPDWFAARDRLWNRGDARFYELNDLLQYLAFFSMRDPLAAFRHSAAQFLHLRGWTTSTNTHPETPHRPAGDVEILRDALIQIATLADEINSQTNRQ
jgi:dihydrodipicolinate synthase/N-acetylneuraminate lyase